MSVTRLLNTAESMLPERDCHPTSLLAFLKTENQKLLAQVAELQRDTAALRRALQSTRAR
jgi:hypothetical protein